MLFCLPLTKLTFFKKIFQEYLPLDPDQDLHFVRLGLGPNCSQRLSADNASGLRVEFIHDFNRG